MNDLFKQNCAVLAQWYAGECKEELQLKFHGEEWRVCEPVTAPPQQPTGNYALRIKPRTITVNGIEVPEPVREPLMGGQKYFVVALGLEDGCASNQWIGDKVDMHFLMVGIIHLTKEAAQLHAEAMIQPSKRTES